MEVIDRIMKTIRELIQGETSVALTDLTATIGEFWSRLGLDIHDSLAFATPDFRVDGSSLVNSEGIKQLRGDRLLSFLDMNVAQFNDTLAELQNNDINEASPQCKYLYSLLCVDQFTSYVDCYLALNTTPDKAATFFLDNTPCLTYVSDILEIITTQTDVSSALRFLASSLFAARNEQDAFLEDTDSLSEWYSSGAPAFGGLNVFTWGIGKLPYLLILRQRLYICLWEVLKWAAKTVVDNWKTIKETLFPWTQENKVLAVNDDRLNRLVWFKPLYTATITKRWWDTWEARPSVSVFLEPGEYGLLFPGCLVKLEVLHAGNPEWATDDAILFKALFYCTGNPVDWQETVYVQTQNSLPYAQIPVSNAGEKWTTSPYDAALTNNPVLMKKSQCTLERAMLSGKNSMDLTLGFLCMIGTHLATYGKVTQTWLPDYKPSFAYESPDWTYLFSSVPTYGTVPGDDAFGAGLRVWPGNFSYGRLLSRGKSSKYYVGGAYFAESFFADDGTKPAWDQQYYMDMLGDDNPWDITSDMQFLAFGLLWYAGFASTTDDERTLSLMSDKFLSVLGLPLLKPWDSYSSYFGIVYPNTTDVIFVSRLWGYFEGPLLFITAWLSIKYAPFLIKFVGKAASLAGSAFSGISRFFKNKMLSNKVSSNGDLSRQIIRSITGD